MRTPLRGNAPHNLHGAVSPQQSKGVEGAQKFYRTGAPSNLGEQGSPENSKSKRSQAMSRSNRRSRGAGGPQKFEGAGAQSNSKEQGITLI